MDNEIIDVKRTREAPVAASPAQKNLVKKPKFGKKNLVTLIMGAVIILALATAGYFYKQYQDVKTNPSQAISEKNSAETDQVLASLKAVLFIEEKDKPTVARVESPETLKKNNETFYKNIQKGDYIVLYPSRAIIFRQSTNQIINIAPIVKSSDLKTPDQQQSEAPPTGTTNTNKTTR